VCSQRLIETLRAYGKPVICAFEATGNYHRPIAWRLIEAGFDVRLVSLMALARTREALHNGWDKNDPRDAPVILHMLRIGATQCSSTRPIPLAAIIPNSERWPRSALTLIVRCLTSSFDPFDKLVNVLAHVAGAP
jgi:hypothetical protein